MTSGKRVCATAETLLARLIPANRNHCLRKRKLPISENRFYRQISFPQAVFVCPQTDLLGANSQTHKSLASLVCCAPCGRYDNPRRRDIQPCECLQFCILLLAPIGAKIVFRKQDKNDTGGKKSRQTTGGIAPALVVSAHRRKLFSFRRY